ncbi:hypothetical protein FS837_005406 [Tulasnella sp. UAMH 9824]|nr:hypothetical protein FS837_005406 [Tulasnella sp. UAMH 9824]
MLPPLFLGLDLSTQQLKASIIDEAENLLYEEYIHFDSDLPHHGTQNGAHYGDREGEVTCPVVVWLEAMDVLFDRLTEKHSVDFGRILAVSGAAQQHGSVYWNAKGVETLGKLDKAKGLVDQLEGGFSLDRAPLWMDSSTTKECRELEEAVGGAQNLADRTGSRAYERFTASQIKRLYDYDRSTYDATTRISLISSFVASLFLGKVAPIEIADASGMNLMDIISGNWDQELLKLCGGESLKEKIGEQPVGGGTNLGKVAKWWVERYGFNEECIVAPFTGDNPSSIVSLSSPGDAILSLGTSTTLLVSIPPSPDPPLCTTNSHMLAHPTAPGGHIGMLCYKNGDLARKSLKDKHYGGSWEEFDQSIKSTSSGNDGYLRFYFPMKEIIPDGVIGEFGFKDGKLVEGEGEQFKPSYSRAICETQLLSIKSRLHHILPHSIGHLHRCIVTGGASANETILHLVADVLDLPVYVAATSASATIGGGLLAQFAWWKATKEGKEGKTFEEMREEVGATKSLKKVLDPRKHESEIYDAILPVYEECEAKIIEICKSK